MDEEIFCPMIRGPCRRDCAWLIREEENGRNRAFCSITVIGLWASTIILEKPLKFQAIIEE